MLVYPNFRYRKYDKCIVECESEVSPYCRKRYVVTYFRHQRQLYRTGRFRCNMCSLMENNGVVNPRYLADQYIKFHSKKKRRGGKK